MNSQFLRVGDRRPHVVFPFHTHRLCPSCQAGVCWVHSRPTHSRQLPDICFLMESRTRTLPKSRSNTRISVMAGTSSGTKKKSAAGGAGGGAGGGGGGGGTSESARLVQHHGASRGGAEGGRLRAAGRGMPAGGPAVGFGAGGGAYGSYQPLCPRSNPVEDCLRAGVAGLGWCLVSWLIGVVLLVLDYARRWGAHRRSGGEAHQHRTPWLIFAPFWVGDFLALFVLARVAAKVSTVRFVSPARGRGRRGDGRVRSTGNLNDSAGHGHHGGGGGGGGGGAAIVALTLEYFPLLQRVVVSAVGGFLLVLVLAAEQVLVCLRWGRDAGDGAAPRALVIAAPLLVLETFFMLRVALIRTHGWLSGLTWVLLFVLTVSVTLRSDADATHEVSHALHSHPWLECLAPLWALDLLYAGVAGYVAANACAGRFVMSPTQGLCFVLFVVALVGSTVAEILLVGDSRLHRFSDQVPRVEYLRLDLPLLLGVISLVAFSLAVFLSAEHSVSRLINTHGYEDPLPLCETPSGWEWSGAGKTPWGLLGDVSVRAEKKVALPAGLSGNKRVAAGLSTSDMFTADGGFSDKIYQRSDSGQYVDIYENL